jgi:hypothetical protein
LRGRLSCVGFKLALPSDPSTQQDRYIRQSTDEMKYFYLDTDDPGLSKVPPSQYKIARTAADSDTYKPGDVIEAWSHVFRWNKMCVPLSQWLRWRNESDGLADAALPSITGSAGQNSGTDLLARLEVAAKNGDPACQKLWEQLHSGHKQPLWPSDEQIRRGQAVFWRYCSQILASELFFSLSAGFSSPRITRILNIASYLVPPMNSTPEGEAPRISKESNDRSFMRLMETTQWLVDCMGDGAMEPGAPGWEATVRVRLLHTTMRLRILEKSRREVDTKGFSVYNYKTDGTPISQEDLIAVITAFAAAPLICLQKIGLSPLPQECEDFTALWRVIGYYLGMLLAQNQFLSRNSPN